MHSSHISLFLLNGEKLIFFFLTYHLLINLFYLFISIHKYKLHEFIICLMSYFLYHIFGFHEFEHLLYSFIVIFKNFG